MTKELELCLEMLTPIEVVVASVVILVALLLAEFLCLRRSKYLRKVIVLTLISEFIFLLLSETVVYRNHFDDHYIVRWIPFEGYIKDAYGEPVDNYWEQVLNVVLFVPFGVLIACLFKKRRMMMAILLSFALSCLVETLQYVFQCGYSEIDDVIHNTLGAVVGCAAAKLLCRPSE